ncbi:MAG TPA: metalloregulator ArsR/SmtB family transcription factor [Bryobacteraceae bacterium]|nr:transcriptional regulator [Bryobacterales bacterium]HRJ18448.1 metalloregulator ArsR/SmtB family transcription factor [Bryobacteraceae bacterium]
MPSILKTFRLLADPNRLRLLLLLEQEELSVAELQEILSLGQSTISTHLAQLKAEELVEDRRTGKHVLYRMKPIGIAGLLDVLRQGAREIPEAGLDAAALRLVLARRRDKVRAYFDELAGKFGRHYVPGRSWKGLAETLLKLLPPLVIADLGAGEGMMAQLLAQRAERVIAVDSSEKMVEFGAGLARKHGLENLDYRLGDMEQLPIEDESVDVAFFSQSLHHAPHPERALGEAHRILRPGGRIAVLDLVKHHFEEARELYADLWLGFSEAELTGLMEGAGFLCCETAIVHREEQAPHLQTLLATGDKPPARVRN